MKEHKAAFEAAFFSTAALWMSPWKDKAEYRVLESQAKASAKVLSLSFEELERTQRQDDLQQVLLQGTEELQCLARELETTHDSLLSDCFRLGMHCGNLLGAAVCGSHLPALDTVLPQYIDNIQHTKSSLPTSPPALEEIIDLPPNAISFNSLIPLVQKVAEWFATCNMSKSPHVFLSYAEEESLIAKMIANRLKSEGISCWLYERDSEPGEPHLIQTGRIIDGCKVLVAIVSEHSLKSEFVAVEIFRGYEKGKAFLPVLVGLTNAEFVSKRPKWLLALGFSTTIQWTDPQEVLDRIVSGLRRML